MVDTRDTCSLADTTGRTRAAGLQTVTLEEVEVIVGLPGIGRRVYKGAGRLWKTWSGLLTTPSGGGGKLLIGWDDWMGVEGDVGVFDVDGFGPFSTSLLAGPLAGTRAVSFWLFRFQLLHLFYDSPHQYVHDGGCEDEDEADAGEDEGVMQLGHSVLLEHLEMKRNASMNISWDISIKNRLVGSNAYIKSTKMT